MSITKIHLFPKNTDAVASLRGYEYQKLKTLEAWLENGVRQKDELIYCEYEEDIFHRNQNTQVSKFRQLKLYSSNFSFSSAEITKAIIHFFSLYTKKEYLFDRVIYVFETNSKIAREYDGNEANLLRSWYNNQNALEESQLKEYATKVKDIVGKFYQEEYDTAKKKGDVSKELESSYAIFETLKEDVWIDFVKSIKWRFDDLNPEDALTLVNTNIKKLILALPYYTEKDNLSSFLGALYREVSNKTIAEKPELRALDIHLLNKLTLEHGTEEDQWYSSIYEEWHKIKSISHFSIGEFYTVIDAAQHCRRNKHLWDHVDLWLMLLESFYNHKDTPINCKRKCVYELAWLNLKVDTETFQSVGTITNLDDKLKFFFKDIDSIQAENDLENILNLLNLLLATLSLNITNFSEKEIFFLIKKFDLKLNNELLKTTDPNRKCAIYEFLGFISFNFRRDFEHKSFAETIKSLYEIVPLLETANVYNITQLSRRVNSLITLFIKFDFITNKEIIDHLEKYSLTLQPYVEKRDGNYKAGKVNIERGVSFIASKRKEGMLKGLDYFHKAKNQLFTTETMDGYVLATLNISQLYTAIGLNFPAKYYALTALWMSINNDKSKLLKRIPQCFSMLQHIDFNQGAWINSISNFIDFIRTKSEFDNTPFDMEKDKMVLKTFNEIAFVLFSGPLLSPSLKPFTDKIKTNLGIVWDESLKELDKSLSNEIKSAEELSLIISKRIFDIPFNDVGKTRTVKWIALGSEWEVCFNNTSVLNSIAEEFCSTLQILIAEIVLTNLDFHLIKGKIKLNIELGVDFSPPQQLPNNSAHEYKIILPELITKNLKEINLHNAKIGASLLTIFAELSLLENDELNTLYSSLLKNSELATKTYTVNTYQRMYKAFYTPELFKLDKRETYQSIPFKGNLPKEIGILKWQDNLSPKYSKENAILHITRRNIKAAKVIGGVLESLKGNSVFKQRISELRSSGWLDWQITLAIFNYVLDQKAKKKIEPMNIQEEKIWVKEFQKAFQELLNQSESEYSMVFSGEDFKSKEFNIQFDQMPIHVLRTWGLEYKAKSPNFNAVREFLNIRFEFNTANTNEGNLLKDF